METMFETITDNNFWRIIDEDKMMKDLSNDEKINTFKHLDLETLGQILHQYRFIVDSHANHLAILISLMTQSPLKSFFGEILYEETGNGKFEKSHLKLFDNFLQSLPYYNFKQQIDPRIEKLLEDYHSHLFHNSINYGIGLGGLGTECICQMYLTALFKQLKQNPKIKAIDNEIDWEFWLIHVGDVDINHRIKMRQMISKFVDNKENDSQDILQGYFKSVKFWDELFLVFTTMSDRVCSSNFA